MAINLSEIAGSGLSVPINGVVLMNSTEEVVNTSNGEVFLRSGVFETDPTVYPNARYGHVMPQVLSKEPIGCTISLYPGYMFEEYNTEHMLVGSDEHIKRFYSSRERSSAFYAEWHYETQTNMNSVYDSDTLDICNSGTLNTWYELKTGSRVRKQNRYSNSNVSSATLTSQSNGATSIAASDTHVFLSSPTGASKIAKYDPNSFAFIDGITTLPNSEIPYSIAINKQTNRLYALCGSGNILEVDIDSMEVTDNIYSSGITDNIPLSKISMDHNKAQSIFTVYNHTNRSITNYNLDWTPAVNRAPFAFPKGTLKILGAIKKFQKVGLDYYILTDNTNAEVHKWNPQTGWQESWNPTRSNNSTRISNPSLFLYDSEGQKFYIRDEDTRMLYRYNSSFIYDNWELDLNSLIPFSSTNPMTSAKIIDGTLYLLYGKMYEIHLEAKSIIRSHTIAGNLINYPFDTDGTYWYIINQNGNHLHVFDSNFESSSNRVGSQTEFWLQNSRTIGLNDGSGVFYFEPRFLDTNSAMYGAADMHYNAATDTLEFLYSGTVSRFMETTKLKCTGIYESYDNEYQNYSSTSWDTPRNKGSNLPYYLRVK